MNYAPKLDYNLKRSFVADTYQVQPQHSNQSRGNLTKRSSFTLLHDFSSTPLSTDLPKTPKISSMNNTNSIPFSMDQFQVASQYYHQNNYVNQTSNQHQVQNHQSFVQHNQYIPQNQNLVQMNQFSGYANRSQSSINRVQLSTSGAEQSHKIQAFKLQQKKHPDPTIQQQLKQLTQRLQKTIQQVSTHQHILMEKKPWQHQISSLQKNLSLHPNHFAALYPLAQLNIDQLRKQIQVQQYHNESSILQLNQKVRKINQNLTKSIECVNQSLNTLVTNLVEIQNRKKGVEMERFRVEVERQIDLLERNFQEKIRRDKQQYEKLTNCSSCQALPTRKVFIGDPILVKFATKVSVSTRTSYKQIEQQQTIYKVDNDGYLLDFEGHYIVNSKYQQIKLSHEQINAIKNMGLLR